MEEMWKQINEDYSISNYGNVKSKNGLLKCVKHTTGYLYATINKKQCLVHRLVAKMFIPNPDNLPQINHIDGNKLNNQVSNLEWCDAKQNMQHAFKNKIINNRTKRKKESELINIKKATISNYKKVEMYDKKGNLIKLFNSIIEASIYSGANASHIVQCCKHKQKICGGYRWEYAIER